MRSLRRHHRRVIVAMRSETDMRNTISKTFIATLALAITGLLAVAPAFARGEGYGGGGFRGGALGLGLGLGAGALGVGALTGPYYPYYGNCSNFPARYDQYGRLIAQC